MKKEAKPNWIKILRDKVERLEMENYYLKTENKFIMQENIMLHKLVGGPPTIMIACEKIVEASAQLATSANNILAKKPPERSF